MHFFDYCKSKAPVLLVNAAALQVLSIFLLLLHNTGTAVVLIVIVWTLVLGIYLLTEYYFRRKYFNDLTTALEELPQKYLIAEVMKPAHRLEDRLYWEILRKSNKSVIEEIHKLESSQKEYKEYIESWIHEVKTPITAAQLLCENRRKRDAKFESSFQTSDWMPAGAGREYKYGDINDVLLELDVIRNEVEKVLYYARMEQVYQDYMIHQVNLREVVLSAIRTEKRHFIQSGIQIDLGLEDTIVSTDEKWTEFMIKQIFSNSMKYRKGAEPFLKIYVEKGEKQKSLVIEDNGQGIPKEDIKRIFEKGFTGQNGRMENSHATGMGLYLCKRLCERLGTGISCESEQGKYTRMILTFPDSDHNKIAAVGILQK